MTVSAAVMTEKGTGPIATIQLIGDSAGELLKKIFVTSGKKPPAFQTSKILVGRIKDNNQTIDHVTIGCHAENDFAIHCHGNPIIVENIMKLLAENGAALVSSEKLLTETLSNQKNTNTIAIEAKLAIPKAKTLQGSKIIANQIDNGLNKTVQHWLSNIDSLSTEQINSKARKILEQSKTAELIINGCDIALIGPPNTGKSTLLNFLAGRQKAIVTNIKGTTRDYVTAQCDIGPLHINLIDTAGMDEKLLENSDSIDKASQQKSFDILKQADMILLVLDITQPADQLDTNLLKKISGKKILTVLNKSDLPAKLNIKELPEILTNPTKISAETGTAIETLKEKIIKITDTEDFDLHAPVCFTTRQNDLLTQLATAQSKTKITSAITELLNAQLPV